jgi:hypothetical protein
MAVPCPFSKLHPQQKSWSLATQMPTETRSQFDFLFGRENSLFFAENSLFAPKNSLFHCVGKCAAATFASSRLRRRPRVRNERLRGPEIDHKLKFRGLLDRQVGRLLAFENAAGVDAGQAVRIGYARSVAHQATRRGKLALDVACR